MLCLDPNISFIIPVFNGEEHLAASLLSLKKQDVTNWEAVIVDDGSIEHTSSISDALALSDSRIQAIHQNNGGVSIARNCGMDIARSNWIAWLDADDQYITGALRKIFSLIDSHQKCNCLQFPYLETCADGSVRKCISRAYNKFGDECYSGQRAFEILFATSPNFAGMNWQPWRFIYRHDSLPHFRNGIIHEDLDVLPLHLATMERVFISKEPLYAYLPARNGAATAVYTPPS